VAGRHYLTKAEVNAFYFATHQMKRPRGWDSPLPEPRGRLIPRHRQLNGKVSPRLLSSAGKEKTCLAPPEAP
jgi:hypothetical protein